MEAHPEGMGAGMEVQSPPVGWYPDNSGKQRYWDGTNWTDYVAPAGAVPMAQIKDESMRTGLVVCGWLGLLFLPIVAIVLGIILCTKPGRVNWGNGIAMLIASVLWISYAVSSGFTY